MLTAEVAPGHYFYANSSFEIKVSGKDGSTATPEAVPVPVKTDDEFMGKVNIYPEGKWVWTFRGAPPFTGTIDYQGCRKSIGGKSALCFRPKRFFIAPGENTVINSEMPKNTSASRLDRFVLERKAVGLQSVAEFREFLAPTGGEIQTEKSGMFDGVGIWLVILLTLVGGLGLNLTPCVLPMIPVNLAIIGDRKSVV